MNTKRINPGACALGDTYIYVFGGRSEKNGLFDSIERYNIELNLWNMLQIRLPTQLCNMFAFPFVIDEEENIVILGGMKPDDKNSEALVTDRTIYMYNKPKEIWFKLG